MMALLLVACDGFEYGFSDPDSAVPDPVWVTERLSQQNAPAVDLLFVVDGTGSMGEELAAISDRAATFVEALDALGIAWQLGATTSDAANGGELQGRPWIITPSTASSAEALALVLDVGANHPPPSAGLDAAALALDPDNAANVGFRRSNAALHVLFLSDDDDQSGPVLGADPVSAFVALLNDEAERTGLPARASAIAGDVPDGCQGSTGSAGAGTRYAAVVAATGGTYSSVCNVDFSVVAGALAESAVDWPREFALQAVPADGSVTATVDGARTTDFVINIEVPSVTFGVAPAPAAVVEVRYEVDGGA